MPRLQLAAAVIMLVSAFTHTLQAARAPEGAPTEGIYLFGGAYAVIGVLLLLRIGFGLWLAAIIPAVPIAFAVFGLVSGQIDVAGLTSDFFNVLHLVMDAAVVVLAVLLIRGQGDAPPAAQSE